MIALEVEDVNLERLLKYPIQLPRTNVISTIITGVVDLHLSHKKIIFSDSTEENQGELRDLLSQTIVKCRAYQLYFHSIKWIGVTNLANDNSGKRNYATLYLYDYSVIYFEALHLLPLLERLWSSQLLLEVRGVKRLQQSSRKDSTRYFQCVVDDLQNSSLETTFHVLEEFTGEVALDLTLKNLCFERTEIFIICLKLIRDLSRLEMTECSFVNDNVLRQVFPAGLAKQVRSQTVCSEEVQRKWMLLATLRLERIVAVLETVCAIFYASDTCAPTLRKSLLLRESPLGLSVWIPLLATDLAIDQLLLLGCIAAPEQSPGNPSELDRYKPELDPPFEDVDFDRVRQRCRSLQLLLLHQLDGISDLSRALSGGSHSGSGSSGNSNGQAGGKESTASSANTFAGGTNASSTAGGLFPRALFAKRPRLGHRAGFLGLSTIQRKMSSVVVPISFGNETGTAGNVGMQLVARLKGSNLAAATEAQYWSCVADALCSTPSASSLVLSSHSNGGMSSSTSSWENVVESLLSLVVQSLNSLCRRLRLHDDDLHNNGSSSGFNTSRSNTSGHNINTGRLAFTPRTARDSYMEHRKVDRVEEANSEEEEDGDAGIEEGSGTRRKRWQRNGIAVDREGQEDAEDDEVLDRRFMKPSEALAATVPLNLDPILLHPPKPSSEPCLKVDSDRANEELDEETGVLNTSLTDRGILASAGGFQRPSLVRSHSSRTHLTVLVSLPDLSQSLLHNHNTINSSRGMAEGRPRSASLVVLEAAKHWEERLKNALSEAGVVEEVLMLFVTSSLLRSLSADSAVVRDALHQHEQATAALRNALGILQTLCPRVNRPALVALQQPDGAIAPPSQLYNAASPSASFASGAPTLSSPTRQQQWSPTKDSAAVAVSVSGQHQQWNPLMASGHHHVNTNANAAHYHGAKKANLFVCEACVIDEFTPSSALATAEVEPEGFLAPYEERWQLLVTSRLNLEDTMRLAQLSLPASFTAVRPITDMA